ncbi:cell division cycle-associated protein 7-like, partial [Lampris incognitus]|uniref:cell division cycle-associated protein 7-like n=1 Tax=Lampris incognitus TaxID=2546036 RepID=UPI0024B53C9B
CSASRQDGVWGMSILSKELADVFAEDSENDRTFHGFSDSEVEDLCDKDSSPGDETEAEPVGSSIQEETSSRRPAARRFKLKVILHPRPSTHHSIEEEKEDKESRVKKEMIQANTAKKEKCMGFGEEETSKVSDSEEDVSHSFLSKREENIKANKAMLAQLMVDLQKIPGGAMLLKNQASKQSKGKRTRPPYSETAQGESRRNPERVNRCRTRSMRGAEDPPAPQGTEMGFSLEKKLLEVRRPPQTRGAPQPSKGKPYVVRTVEEITEDELQLVADNMTEKVYNKVMGSTCHQCRQKTVDTKTSCRSDDCHGIQGQFCGPCLRNRYGEDVRQALLDPEWQCPPCRGICNCSFCRQREGRCPTGILFPLAQYHGFSNVHSYLSSLRNKLKTERDVNVISRH